MAIKRAEVCVLAGTKKGAFIFQSDRRRRRWKMKGPFFENSPVFHMCFDRRDGRSIYAAVNSYHFGPTVQRTRSLGRKWENAKSPPRFADRSELKVEQVWHVEPGHADEAEVVYAGIAPAALFRSEDGGNTWKLNESLNNHPTRPNWQPGAGGLCLHSIAIDPSNSKRMYVGISAVGILKTEDAGESWNFKNKNVRADYMPTKYPEYGQCVHKLLMDPNRPSFLYQQNHCGVYRTEDAAENWTEVSRGLPSGFGFPLAVHPRESETFYVVPEQGDFFRVTANREFAVYGTSNAGRNWRKLNKGLPNRDVYIGCHREGLATDQLDPAGIYVGTTTGHLFHSPNEGRSWQLLAQWLPPVHSVSTATTGG